MAKVQDLSEHPFSRTTAMDFFALAVGEDTVSLSGYMTEEEYSKLAAPEGSTLAGSARTDAPSGVPMSGGAEPAGAAKPSPEGRP